MLYWHGRARTYDRPGNNRVLYQLSYMPLGDTMNLVGTT